MKLKCIGKIVNTRGLNGELKILSETDFKDERYSEKGNLYIFFGGKYLLVKVESYRVFKGHDILKFKGLDNINQVEKFKGSDLFAEDIKIELENPNEFHSSQLIGLKVMQKELVKGKVESIREMPQGDYLNILKPDGTISPVPFRDEFIINIDLDESVIEIVDMEGLL